jgi:hypothetical protein
MLKLYAKKDLKYLIIIYIGLHMLQIINLFLYNNIKY